MIDLQPLRVIRKRRANNFKSRNVNIHRNRKPFQSQVNVGMFVKAILCIRVACGSLPPPGALRPGRLFFAAPAFYPSAPDFFATRPGSRPRLPQYMAAYESLTFKLVYNYILPIYADRRNSSSDIKQPICCKPINVGRFSVETFSDSLVVYLPRHPGHSQHPHQFPDVFIDMLKSGLCSGSLHF